MKTKLKQSIFIGITIAITTAFLLLIFLPGNQPVEYEETVPGIVPQQANERIWVKEPLKKLFTSPITLHNPSYMKFYGKELYIADLGDMKLKRISLNGQLINTIGNGPGRGPGEMNAISGFSKENEYVWMFDHRTRTVFKFSKSGEFIESILVKEQMGLMVTGDTLIFKNPLSAEPFVLYDTKGKKINSFGSFIANQTDHPLAIFGTFYKNNNTLYYLPLYASYVIRFNKEFEPVLLQLIDKTAFLTTDNVQKAGGQVQMFAPNPEIKMRDLSFDGDTMSVLTEHRTETENVTDKIIDQYLLPHATYLRSFSLPNITRRALVKNDLIYSLTDTSMVVYKLEL